jgi:hypothetical protein
MSANTLLRGVGLRRPARGRLCIRSLLLIHGTCVDLTLKCFLEAIKRAPEPPARSNAPARFIPRLKGPYIRSDIDTKPLRYLSHPSLP